MNRHILSVVTALAGILGLSVLMMAATVGAQGTEGGDTPGCTPQTAWTEYVEHPAETHIEQVLVDPGSPAIPAVPEVWANFSPNHQQGPFDGPPSWPNDERGEWHVHDKIPGGHEGPDGVYQRDKGGNGRADWFYRQAGVPEVPAVPPTYEDKVVVDKEAWTEEVFHPAVECPTETVTVTEPTEPTETVTLPTETVTVTPPTETVTLPTETATVTETPEPTDTPPTCLGRPKVNGPCGEETTDSTPVPTPDDSGTPTARADVLPNTGGPMLWIVGIGSALVIIGALLVGFQGQRKAS